MPWKVANIVEQRLQFVLECQRNEYPKAQVCRMFGVTRVTGDKWLRRYATEGIEGVKDLSRAPKCHPNEVPREIEAAVVAARHRHPTWGPKKLRVVLGREHPATVWPACSTIGEILNRHGLTVPRKRRRRVPPQTEPFAACDSPNAVWCTDFKGWFCTGDSTRCEPFTLSDGCTRYVFRTQGLEDKRTKTVQPLFEAAFREYGLPWAMRSDNGSPFASCGVGGLSRLSVWWIKLGIVPERIDPGHPEQNGRHERMHLTLKLETASPPARTLRGQQRRFDAFRREFNEERPHEALGMATPASVYTPSPRPYPERLGEMEYPQGVEVRRVQPDGKFSWKHQDVFLGEALGAQLVGFSAVDDRYRLVSFGPKALGLFDTHGRTMVRRRQLRRILKRLCQAGAPSATLQGLLLDA